MKRLYEPDYKSHKQVENYLKQAIRNTSDAEEQDIYQISLEWLFSAQNMKEFIAGMGNPDPHYEENELDRKISKKIINYVRN